MHTLLAIFSEVNKMSFREEPDFLRLTPAEKRLVEVYLEEDSFALSAKEIAEKADITTKYYYDLINGERFSTYINGLINQQVGAKMALVLQATFNHALKEGNHQDRKMLLEKYGMYTQRQEIELSAPQIVEDVPTDDEQ